MPMADNCTTIPAVTQAPHPGCPRSPGTLSAINLERVSAISGMRGQALNAKPGSPNASVNPQR